MRAIIALFVLAGLVASQDMKSLLQFCENPPKTPPKTLSEKLSLPESYKVSGSITDWMKSSTSLLVESATKESRVVQRQSHQLTERWVHNLTGEKTTMMVNVTSGKCDANAAPENLLNISRFEEVVGNDTSSLHSIIQGLIEFDKTHSGFLVDDRVDVVGGVNAMRWVSCIDGSANSTTKILLEVRYAGEDSIIPAHTSFSNPLILSIRLAELPSFNSTVPINHVSLELDRYEQPDGSEGTFVEHGIFCTNRNTTNLPVKKIDEYAATLNYFDFGTNRSEVVEVLYSDAQQVFIVAGDSFEKGVKILAVPPEKYPNGTDYVLHDFRYGYEFTMSRGGCSGFQTFEGLTNDAMAGGNDTYSLKFINWILLNQNMGWNQYPSDLDAFGQKLTTWRAFDPRDETIVEAHLTADLELHSYAIFHQGSRHLALTMVVSRIPIQSSRLNVKNVQLSNCYDVSPGNFSNNTWMFEIKDKTLTDVSKVGLNRLNEALTNAIAKNVHAVIPYRINAFYEETPEGQLRAVLRIAEKTQVAPGHVGYNFTGELSTEELFGMLNSTILGEKMVIEVEKVGGVKETWNVDSKSLHRLPSDNESRFIGYTGGAMFVLAIFCLLIGVATGAIGVFVATRRQRISTLAYQVFE